jgi:hypothetical protein
MLTGHRNAVLLEVADFVGELAHRRLDDDSALADLTGTAAKLVPGAQYAGIAVVRRGAVETVGATHRYVASLDDVAQEHAEGPCLSAAWDKHIVLIDDLTTETRWPRYRRAAMELTPIRSILSFGLFGVAKSGGALSFYAEQPHIFDGESVEMGLVFATHTALLGDMVRRSEQFQSALASRDIIGQAKGMFMERFNINAEQAFELLTRLSQNSNVPVAEIARQHVYANHPP